MKQVEVVTEYRRVSVGALFGVGGRLGTKEIVQGSPWSMELASWPTTQLRVQRRLPDKGLGKRVQPVSLPQLQTVAPIG